MSERRVYPVAHLDGRSLAILDDLTGDRGTVRALDLTGLVERNVVEVGVDVDGVEVTLGMIVVESDGALCNRDTPHFGKRLPMLRIPYTVSYDHPFVVHRVEPK